MSALGALFDAVAADYDAERKLLVPQFDGFYGAALSALGTLPKGARVLDLGAGTGLLSALVAARNPQISLTLVDISAGMLDRAAARFDAMEGAAPEIVVADFRAGLPVSACDTVISGLAIHHLENAEKQTLFARIAGALPTGGLFLNADQVLQEAAAAEAEADREWERSCQRLGATEAMIAAARTRMAHDKCATIDAQLNWLNDCGFSAQCPWAEGRFAVFAARKV